ncbi:MAG TPA: GAF domain-containing protein [Acidimicrobiales bacterium]|nr:GAF domain-containing protein [Acidimicrobiales bacterium]
MAHEDHDERGRPARGRKPSPAASLAIAAAEGAAAIATARRWAREVLDELGCGHLLDDVELLLSELVTNAVIHTGSDIEIAIGPTGIGVRIEVRDEVADRMPVTSGTGLLELLQLDDVDDLAGGLTDLDVETMTGRGMTVVEAVSDRWGAEVSGDGKVVWAELATGGEGQTEAAEAPTAGAPTGTPSGTVVRVPGVPVRLVLTAAAQLDDLVRELAVTSLPSSLPPDIVDVASRFVTLTAEVRDPFRVAARAAVERHERLLDVSFPVSPVGVEVLRGFLDVLERITELSVRGELLCLAPPSEIMAFRRWAVDEIGRQVGGAPPTPCPFPVVPADDPAVAAAARLASAAVAAAAVPGVTDGGWLAVARVALRAATDHRQVAEALVAAGDDMGAVDGSLCILAPDGVTVELVAAVNYEDDVRGRWATFPITDDTPAGEVIRTGRGVYLRTGDELVARFPVFLDSPRIDSEALAVVPVRSDTTRGALAIGFRESRTFGPDEIEVLEALGRLVSEALDRL